MFGFKWPDLPGISAVPVPPASGFCAQYQTVYDTMLNKPSDPVAITQNTMAQTLVDGDVWGEGDLIYLPAQEFNLAGEADINWINPGTFPLVEVGVGALGWTSLEGYTGDGTNYLSTGWNPSTDAINYLLDACTIAIYLRVDINAAEVNIGCTNGVDQITLFPRLGGSFLAYINDGSSSKVVADSLGMFIVTRPDAATMTFYKNGADLGDSAKASTAIPNDILEILARGGGNLSNNQVSFVFIGGLLGDAEVITLSNAVNTYMTSNGKNVY